MSWVSLSAKSAYPELSKFVGFSAPGMIPAKPHNCLSAHCSRNENTMAKKYRKMLTMGIPALDEIMAVLSTQSKPTIVNWTVDYAEAEILPVWLKQHPHDERPAKALTAARSWLAGEIKLPEAKQHILACHAAARENDENPTAQAAARALGQAASTIHMPSHSLGIALYGALARAYDELGIDAPWPDLEAYSAEECERMLASLREAAIPDEPHPAKINWGC